MGEAERNGAGRRSSPLPSGRAERLGRLGSMLAGMAGEAALESLRRAAGRAADDGSLLLTPANAERLSTTLAELRGAAMKLGQLLSLQGDDLLPPELAGILASLRNRADYMPEEQVREVLVAELGSDWRSRLREFDFEPLAAASIGQVHGAESADGSELALKIQYPGVAKSIDSDVDTLATLLRVSRLLPPELEFETLVPELKTELRREADYRREAANTERFRALVVDDRRLHVPAVHHELSTGRVLALERVWALPIEDLRSPEHSGRHRNGLAGSLARLVFRELFEFRFMQTDPNFANYLYEPKQGRIALLDFGSARAFPEPFTESYRALIMAAAEGADADLLEQGEGLGFLRGDEDPATRSSFLELARLSIEPLCKRGPYDFAASDLGLRLRDRSLVAYREHTLPRPPTGTLFLHRKLAGTFLLCAHIGATVDCHALYKRLIRS
jgi:predicted unusual protein kinase regulating ubiquinone biosynthesis (AarF/ABC1/UbiB family)